jgi:hypothetical protein
MSRFTVDFRMVIGATKAAQPTMSRELKMLDPKTLPTAMSGVDFKADSRLTKNSGMEVPMATIVSPITICDMCMRSAMATAPSVSRSAPHNTRAIPAIIHKMFNHIIFVFVAKIVQAENKGNLFSLSKRCLSYAKIVQAESKGNLFTLLRRCLSYAKIKDFYYKITMKTSFFAKYTLLYMWLNKSEEEWCQALNLVPSSGHSTVLSGMTLATHVEPDAPETTVLKEQLVEGAVQ